MQAIAGRIEAIISQDVLDEVERNLSRKAPDLLARYRQLLHLMEPTTGADPSPEEVRAAEAYVAQKDAPIVAAAIKARVDYLVTYDRKHLLKPVEVARLSGLTVATPADVLAILRQAGEE